MHHRSPFVRGLSRTRVLVISSATLAASTAGAMRAPRATDAPMAPVPTAPAPAVAPAASGSAAAAASANGLGTDSLFGRSGKLRARFLSVARPLGLTFLRRLLGDTVATEPGRVYAVANDATPLPLAFITMLPFADKVNGRLGGYRMGFWPAERRVARSDNYTNPSGFIRVTRENQDMLVSEHFRLRDFLTHDQQDVWPKYLVLREELIDKLELVISDLEAHGTPVRRMVVMSGFRTPQYNEQGVGAGGRAQDSRHQYGDAADVFVDNNGDGRMDDLNGDHRVDSRDAQVLIDAAERVEHRHPTLLGGAGRYRATGAHGPFAHIDVRGYRARWGNA